MLPEHFDIIIIALWTLVSQCDHGGMDGILCNTECAIIEIWGGFQLVHLAPFRKGHPKERWPSW